MKTSISDPIQIAYVPIGVEFGRIGITFCPGKYDPDGGSGAWDRDLILDLDDIYDSGAAAIVTLLEPEEFELLRVEQLGQEVLRRGTSWFHLPIVDQGTPDASFENDWVADGEAIRAILRNGFDVVLHCRGGLGRAGTIAARLLIEFGAKPSNAMIRVRDARRNAIENFEQESFVLALESVPEKKPQTANDAIRDRAVGALLGLAVGDAVGTTLEFSTRDSTEALVDMIGGGPFGLKAGEWTDDTAMALALADSLLCLGAINEQDLLARFVKWWKHGDYSCTGDCFDIGLATREALSRWQRTGDPHSGSTDPMSAGNGSLMRLSPVAVRFWNDRVALADAAARQSKTTHGAPEAVDACIAFGHVLADAIQGCRLSEVFRNRPDIHERAISAIMRGSWRGKKRDEIRASGYVVHTLEAALWCVARTGDFRSAVLLAANLADDADTTAAVVGQLAGAIYGATGIPKNWVKRVAWRDKIVKKASGLLAASGVTA